MKVFVRRWRNVERVLLAPETSADFAQCVLLSSPPYCWQTDPSGEGVYIPLELSSSVHPIEQSLIADAIRRTHASARQAMRVTVSEKH